MGMFDYVSIDQKLIEKHNIKCQNCGLHPPGKKWKKKDFENYMDEYYLCDDDKGDMRLYKLDPPSKEYWVTYTNEEVEEKNKATDIPWFRLKIGDGHYKKEAFLLENRRKRHMGELPHQIVSIYTVCNKCRDDGLAYPKGWLELDIKFTDGVVVNFSQKGE